MSAFTQAASPAAPTMSSLLTRFAPARRRPRLFDWKSMKIFVSGLYCGGNPQPGVGIVRSLRQAYPEATLVGVEYSNRVSGIHWEELDTLWMQRPWDELDLPSYGERLREALDAGGLWISGSDLEAMWLADIFPEGHRNLLAPPMGALRR